MSAHRPAAEDELFVGRPSKWGNPYKLNFYSRDEAIKKYEQYINRSDLKNQLHELDGLKLFCFCAPMPCHADVLIRKSKNMSIKISEEK